MPLVPYSEDVKMWYEKLRVVPNAVASSSNMYDNMGLIMNPESVEGCKCLTKILVPF